MFPEKSDRPVAIVKPTLRASVKKPTVDEETRADSTEENIYSTNTETDEESDESYEVEYDFYPEEEYLQFSQPSANDQQSTLERDYVKMSPSVSVRGVFHDRSKAWQFNDLIAYIDFDQDINVISKHYLLAKEVLDRFIKLDSQNRLTVSVQLVINHEIFNLDFFVIDDFIHRKPVLLKGSRWRNIRHIRLAQDLRTNENRLYGAIFGYQFFKFIDLKKALFNTASLHIQETKLGYVISGRSRKTDIPIEITGSSDQNDSDVEEYDPEKPRDIEGICNETGTVFNPPDVLNYEGPRVYFHRRLRLDDGLFRN